MKVLFCTNAFSRVSNGPAKFANLLARNSFLSNGDEIRILTEDCGASSENVYQLPLRYPSFLKPFSQFIRMLQYHRAAMKIRKTYAFDALIYNNALVGFWSMLFFRGTFGMVNDYTNATWKEDAAGFRGESGLKRQVFFYIEMWFCRLSKNPVLTNSRSLSEILGKAYQLPPASFRTLHKGIEKSLVNQNRQALLPGKIPDSILFVKTNYQLAGFRDLASALLLMDKAVCLTVIGPPESSHQEIRSLFEQSKVILDLRAQQNQEEVFLAMRQHKVFCLPSYKEAFGVSILEALACACRVVASEVGGIPEALGKGPWAFLSEAGNPNMLAEKLNAALESPDSVIGIELDAHLSNFSEETLINRFMNLLRPS